jgi:DNA-binding transcriptional regulator YiaG
MKTALERPRKGRRDEASSSASPALLAAVVTSTETPAASSSPRYPSAGRQLLRARPESSAELGRALGCSRATVSAWRVGSKVPSASARASLELRYAIPAQSWDRTPHGYMPPPLYVDVEDAEAEADEPTDEDENGGGGLDADWCRLIASIRSQLRRPDILARERMELQNALIKALEKRRRFQREHEMLEDRTIREHPNWKRLKNAITDALIDHPAAARAVEAVIVRLIGTSDDSLPRLEAR